MNRQKGFLVIEVMIAAALFVIFSSGIIAVVLQAFDGNRLGSEETTANQYAAEGLEAVRSIKNQSFSNLVSTTSAGLMQSGGVWTVNGISNSFGKYTRVISISAVLRDGSGNIVSSGGSTDSATKKVTSTVSWKVNAARNDSVILSTYLTNWRSLIGEGLVVYGSTTSLAQPKYRSYVNSTDTFSPEATVSAGFTDAVVGKTFKLKTSPTKQEVIEGYVNNSGVLRIMCFDGTTWSNEWTVTVGGTGTNDQRFGIGYEQTSGDVLVVYSTNTAASNEMAYRTKLGTSGCGASNWSGATNITTARTTGIVQWIRMEPSSVVGSNTIGIAWADANSDLSAMEWTGSSFAVAEPASVLEANLEIATTAQDVMSFDIVMESTSGNFMVVWGPGGASCTAGSTCMKYARYTGSWSAAAGVPTVADFATNIDCSANPNSNEVVCAALDNGTNRLDSAYWSGTTWTGFTSLDTTTATPLSGTKLVATGWLINGATTRYVIVYNDTATTNIGWYVGNGATTPVVQTDFTPTPVFANPQKWYDIQTDPKNKDRLMFSLSDNNSDLFAKRLVMTSTPTFTWTNSDGGSALQLNLGQATTGPF